MLQQALDSEMYPPPRPHQVQAASFLTVRGTLRV